MMRPGEFLNVRCHVRMGGCGYRGVRSATRPVLGMDCPDCGKPMNVAEPRGARPPVRKAPKRSRWKAGRVVVRRDCGCCVFLGERCGCVAVTA